MMEIRKRVVNSWIESGLLDGLANGDRPNIALLLESQATMLLEEQSLDAYLEDRNYFEASRILYGIIKGMNRNIISKHCE